MAGASLTGMFVAILEGTELAEEIAIGQQAGIQIVGVIATMAWCAAASFVIFEALDTVTGLRVSEEQEMQRLDNVMHEHRGYKF
ncbi:MAG: hypothetical protein ACE10E_06415 [Acidiferrobacterales bacterium]|nr:hypothetical protein [Gammaproteobacteria bacterium]